MRLVLLFALVAVLPGALVYAVSVQFLGKSIESWFDVRVDRALEGGLNLASNSLDYLLKDVSNKASQIALTLAEGGPGSVSTRLNRAAEQAGVYEAALFSSTRRRARRRRRRRLDRAAGAAAARRRCAARGCSRPTRRSSRRPTAGSCCAWSFRSTATTGSSRSRCCR